jgi:hypothetical protein
VDSHIDESAGERRMSVVERAVSGAELRFDTEQRNSQIFLSSATGRETPILDARVYAKEHILLRMGCELGTKGEPSNRIVQCNSVLYDCLIAKR